MVTNKNAILSIMGALAAGVVMGVLLAPGKGKDTRKKIRKAAADWAESLGELWLIGKQVAEKTEEREEDGQSSAEKIADKIRSGAY